MAIWETIFFYVFATGALLTSIGVIVFRNPLYSAISLIVDFFFFAGLYVLLSAHFMALIQVLVYGGAIMVLFMFIIMLLNLRDDELEQPVFRAHYAIAIAVSIGLFAFIASAASTLVNQDSVASGRAAAVEKYEAAKLAAADGDTVETPQIATLTPVPGLYADLNEPAMQASYNQRMQDFASGQRTPADGKYQPVNNRPKFVVPPMLDPNGKKPPSFGTVEPISILLVNRFVVPFELTAILLLAAIIGAVIIAKKRL